MTRPGFAYVWVYSVRPEQLDDFLKLYSCEGEWVELFQRAEGFVRTELARDATDPDRYMTIDYWSSREARDQFRIDFAGEFAALDAAGEQFTVDERFIGDFEILPASR